MFLILMILIFFFLGNRD